jgi:hypothetical protein
LSNPLSGIQFWFALIFSLLLSVSGTFVLVINKDPGIEVLGWMLVAIGSLFFALNLALRQRQR